MLCAQANFYTHSLLGGAADAVTFVSYALNFWKLYMLIDMCIKIKREGANKSDGCRAEDCGKCSNCMDKKIGGPGNIKRRKAVYIQSELWWIN